MTLPTRFFKRFFQRCKTEEIRPMVRNAECYYCARGILIAATYWDIDGLQSGGPPMVLLPPDAPEAEIGNAVLAGLASSRTGLTKEEVQSLAQEMFKVAKVGDWSQLEREWESIHIYIEPEAEFVVITPMRRYATGGYGTNDDDPIYRRSSDSEDIGKLIRSIIDGPTPDEIELCPSHT